MLGVDDFLVILLATTAANLLVEVGAEVVAEWMVNSPDSPFKPPDLDPSAASEQIRYVPESITQISAQADQTTLWSERISQTLGVQVSDHLAAKIDQTAAWSGQAAQVLSHKADALSVKAAQTAAWSEQMISTLSTSLGIQ